MRRLLFAGVVLTMWSLCLRGMGQRVWNFADGLQGWQPANWESLDVTEKGLRGRTRYDSQLLSPPLSLRAEDVDLLVVRLKSSASGPGETFYAAPGQSLSDGRKLRHELVASEDFRLYRIDMRQALGDWRGPIERLRFDPLNPAGVDVTIDFIALIADADQRLLNGSIEIVRDGRPFQWIAEGAASGTAVSAEVVHGGLRALELRQHGRWHSTPIDTSFLGTLKLSGFVQGKRCRASLCFFDAGGDILLQEQRLLDAADTWEAFSLEATCPSLSRYAQVRFKGTPEGPAYVDDVSVLQMSRGRICEEPPDRPRWTASWIWHPDALDEDNCSIFLSREFTLPDTPISEAVLQVTADDAYRLQLNGRALGHTVGETDGWRTPELIDVTDLLVSGLNRVRVEAVDVSSAQGFIAELVVVFDDGSEYRLQTDGSWEARLPSTETWVPAAEQGTPPCLPWRDLPYQPLGRLPTVSVQSVCRQRQGDFRPGITLDVTVTAADAVERPVGIEAVVLHDGDVVFSEWAPRQVFVTMARPGARDRLRDWRILLPYGLPAGTLQGHLNVVGAEVVEGNTAFEVASPARDASTREFARAEIVTRGGVPGIEVNGMPIDPTQNIFIRPDRLHQRHACLSDIPIWTIGLDEIGFYEDGFDYTKVDRTLAYYLSQKPDAWLILTFTMDTRHHTWWIRQHPEARCRLEDGSDRVGEYHGARRILPSFSSDIWRREFTRAVVGLIRHLRTTPFAPRIIGFHPCNGISWEWFHWGAQSGELVDYSPCAQKDFRRWLRETYVNDTGLQKGWSQANATLAKATVPTGEDRRQPARGIFFDPRTQQHVIDYNQYQHEIVAETILHFARVIKEETSGRSLVGTYYGYVTHLPETPGFCQGSGHFRLNRLLEADSIDYLMAPVAYAWRDVGGTAATMTVAESFALHGKLFWNQADLRTHWSEQSGYGRPDTLAGSIACMRRELARNLAAGTAIQWYDFSRGWTFGDERLARELDLLQRAGHERRGRRSWGRGQTLLVVVDERQMGRFDPFQPPYGLSLIYRQRQALARAGVPWQAVLFSDLKAYPELLEHRCVMLLNLFYLTDDDVRFLREKLLTAERTVACIGPVGMVSSQGLEASRPSTILGWPMQLIENPVPVAAVYEDNLDGAWASVAGLRLGVSKAYPPLAAPAQTPPAARVLARFEDGSIPAVLWERRRDLSLFWSAVPGLTPELIRILAENAGLPVICTSGDAIYAGRGFVGIHASHPGTKQLHLPVPAAAVDVLSGRTWDQGTRTVTLDMDTGDTVMLRLE